MSACVGHVRYRHFAIVCSCGETIGSDVELTDEQVSAVERDSRAGLHLLPRAEALDLAAFFTQHTKLGHEPVPALVGDAWLHVWRLRRASGELGS